MRAMAKCAALLAAACAPVCAQPKAVELYVMAGGLWGGGDESSPGSGAAYGAALTVPLARKLALDIGVQNARLVRDFGPASTYFRVRRWMVSPALLYRFGNERVYGFAGGGMGSEMSRSLTIEGNFLPDYRPPGWQEIGPGVWKTSHSLHKTTVHARAGLVVSPVNRLVVRFELNAAWAHVLPNRGLTVGVGYRF